MSLEALGAVASHPQISMSMAGFCMILANCHNAETGKCNPSIKWISHRFNCARSTVFKYLDEAESLGILRRQAQYIDGRQTTSNIEFLYAGQSPGDRTSEGLSGQTHEGPSGRIQKQEVGKQEINIVSQQFEEFWSLYPRKTAKKPARTKWNRLTKTDREAALNHIRSKPYEAREAQFIPHPSTYLNQERWNDQPDLLTIPDNVTPMRGI